MTTTSISSRTRTLDATAAARAAALTTALIGLAMHAVAGFAAMTFLSTAALVPLIAGGVLAAGAHWLRVRGRRGLAPSGGAERGDRLTSAASAVGSPALTVALLGLSAHAVAGFAGVTAVTVGALAPIIVGGVVAACAYGLRFGVSRMSRSRA